MAKFVKLFEHERYIPNVLVETNTQFQKIAKAIDKIANKSEAYKPGLAKNVIKVISKQYKTLEDLPKDTFPVKLTVEFKVMFFVHSAMYASHKIQLMHDNFMQERSLKAKLEEEKGKLRTLFKNTANSAIEEKIAADILCSILSARLIETVKEEIQMRLKIDTENDFKRNKFHLIVQVLKSLHEKECFEDYMRYVCDPEVYSSEWFEEYFERKMEKQYESVLEYTLEKKMMTVIDCFRENCKAYQTMPGDCLEGFCNSIKLEVPLPYSEVKEAAERKIVDIGHFEKLVIQTLNENHTQIKTEIAAAKGKWYGTPPYQAAFQKVWGCKELCPFCKEPCQLSDEDHTGTAHHTIQHKPRGINGRQWERTGALVVEPCSFAITTDSHCFKEDGKSKYYREYKKYYPDWDITPSPKVDSCKYWMRFMWQYKDQLASHYTNSNIRDVPSTWGRIDEKDAMQSLHIFGS